MKTELENRIEKMRNGEKIKCPKCDAGYFSAIGDPQRTNVFKCNMCNTRITLTVPLDK